MRHEKTTPPMMMGRHSHLATEGGLLYMRVATYETKSVATGATISQGHS